MLESMRNIGKVVLALTFGMGGVFAFLAVGAVILAAVDLLVLGNLELFLTHMFFAVVIGGLVFCFIWMGHDAASELKSIQTQKEEIKDLDPKDIPLADVPTKEPWLYP